MISSNWLKVDLSFVLQNARSTPVFLLLSLSTRQSQTSTTRCRFRYTPSHTRGCWYHLNLPPTRPISATNSPHPFPLFLSLSTRQSLTSTTRCRFRYTPSHTRGGCYHLNLPPTRPISAANLPHLPPTRPISAANSPHPFPFLLYPFPFCYINFRRTFIFHDTV